MSKYQKLGSEIGELVDQKQKQYGDSFSKCSRFLELLYPNGVEPKDYIHLLTIVRIFDKLMRVANGNNGDNESPFKDIAGYAILGEQKSREDKRPMGVIEKL